VIPILLEKTEALIRQGSLVAARSLLEDLAQMAPDHPPIYAKLGMVCGYLKDHPTAIRHLEKAEELDNNLLEVVFTLGYEYCQVGRYKEAVSCFDKLIVLVPLLSALHCWRGNALAGLGRWNEAWQEFQEALRLKPDSVEVLRHMANLLYTHCQLDKAEQYLLQALIFEPGQPEILNDLGRIYRVQGCMDEAVACFRKIVSLRSSSLAAISNYLYCQCYIQAITPEKLAEEHRLLAHHFCSQTPFTRLETVSLTTHLRKLRIGYISGDLATHSVAYFLEPILQHHDHQHFDVFCYSNRAHQDATTQRLKAFATGWRDIFGVPSETVANWVSSDGIDLLVDLSGHSAGHRLDVMALRPAPVQCSWIGYPHSTGLSQIDYYISDAQCDPPSMTEHLYSERLWRLPRVFSCYLPPMDFPIVSPVPCLAERWITFGSFNNLAKVNQSVIALWAAILRAIPESRIILKSGALGGEKTRQTVLRRFARYGIAPERVVLQPFAANTVAHLAQYGKIDIVLDTYPYHGTTTTCEALFMGVPVVTLAGTHHLSRVGVSFLHAVGLDDLIAGTPNEYIMIASDLARNRQRLVHIRERLRGMMVSSPLMDAVGVTKEVESAYKMMITQVSVKSSI
jgi:predicted O-linked N-acetylglucosamine transferase (SPINDLY family)